MRRNRTSVAVAVSPMRWITHVAFVLALAVVIARLTTPDVLRDPWAASPGSAPMPSGPGVATGLVFDLLACLPAILVLVRRSVDRRFAVTLRWSHLLLFFLATWMAMSTAWSSDKFAAAATSAHFFSACCLLWAMSQLVRSAVRFRLVASISFGLLLALVAQSVLYRFVDVPENISYWNEKKTEILKQHDWAPDSFSAKQFEHKLISGELVGFFNSANTFAAVGVLLFAACVGLGIQKIKEGENVEWLALPVIAAIALVWILTNARSKTSAATPFVGAGALFLFIAFQSKLREHHRKSYLIAVCLVVFALIAVVGHGVYHHGLFPGHFSNSLDFRWKYWVASAGVFAGHPLIGVGWGNFGLNYLAHRLPEAAEEIKDPHNFLVRFFVELGVVGGFLCIAWLLRLAWEITKPSSPAGDADDDQMTVKSVATIVLLGMLLSVAANIDFSLPAADVLALLMRPALYFLAILFGAIAGSMRSPHKWSLDDRPVPWIFYCMVTGLGLFLLHNLIDFSWFEAGAMATFMALIGSSLGILHGQQVPKPGNRPLAITATVAATVGFIIAAVFFVCPVIAAEQFAAEANDSIATSPVPRSEQTVEHYRQAADDLRQAALLIPYNSDYLFRQADAILGTGDYASALPLLAHVKQINPLQIDAYLLDANLRLQEASPDQAAVRADFDTIVRLNPNDVSLRVQYGTALDHFGAKADARQQYKMALNANAALPIGEPKRLPADQVLRLQIAAGAAQSSKD